MSELRYDSQIVTMTRASGRLGKENAFLFASRGANIIVIKLGGAFNGGGAGQTALPTPSSSSMQFISVTSTPPICHGCSRVTLVSPPRSSA